MFQFHFTRLTNKNVKMLYGVLASLAYYWNIPSWVIRLIFVSLCFYSSYFVALYFIIVIFSDTDDTITKEQIKNKLKNS